jgi:hypothetical protein
MVQALMMSDRRLTLPWRLACLMAAASEGEASWIRERNSL